DGHRAPDGRCGRHGQSLDPEPLPPPRDGRQQPPRLVKEAERAICRARARNAAPVEGRLKSQREVSRDLSLPHSPRISGGRSLGAAMRFLFVGLVTLLLLATQAHAAGVQFITVPESGSSPALVGMV